MWKVWTPVRDAIHWCKSLLPSILSHILSLKSGGPIFYVFQVYLFWWHPTTLHYGKQQDWPSPSVQRLVGLLLSSKFHTWFLWYINYKEYRLVTPHCILGMLAESSPYSGSYFRHFASDASNSVWHSPLLKSCMGVVFVKCIVVSTSLFPSFRDNTIHQLINLCD